MIAALADSRRAVVGLWRLIVGDPSFPGFFDVTASGLVRSFSAVLIGLPIYILIIAAVGHANAALGAPSPMDTPRIAYAVILYLASWAYFPFIALLLVLIVERPAAFTPWVVVHNWATLVLLALHGFFWILYLNGMLSPRGPNELVGGVLLPASLVLHWRIAVVTVGVPWTIGAGLACAHVLVDTIIQLLLFNAFEAARA